MKAGKIMMEWDSRMQNNHSVKVLKAAIPFLDVEIGEKIDMEGLLQAVRPFAGDRERKILDIFLQFFQMRRMMEMMQLVQAMQEMQSVAQDFPGSADGEVTGENQSGQDSFMGMPSPDMMSMLKTMIPPEQQEMVDSMTAMMSMMQSRPEEPGEGEKEDEPVDI